MFGHLRAVNVEKVCRICLKDLDDNKVDIFAAPYNDGEALASEIERVFYIKVSRTRVLFVSPPCIMYKLFISPPVTFFLY